MRREIQKRIQKEKRRPRLLNLLNHLGFSRATWYRKAKAEGPGKRRGPLPLPIPEPIREAVLAMARENPWYGYKRIAVMCRREGDPVADRQCYRVMRAHDLLQKKQVRKAALYQAAKLYELLPQRPNDLWQMDVTYVHIPGYGWRYAVTVIDYFSRYLLVAYLTDSYRASEVTRALELARQEAERLHGPLERPPFLVTDNGSSFISRHFADHVEDRYAHVRIQCRTPTQLGLLERFHETLKREEVYWRVYENPEQARRGLAAFRKRYNQRRPHWALRPVSGGDPLTPAEVYTDPGEMAIPAWQTWIKGAKEKLDRLMAGEDLPEAA